MPILIIVCFLSSVLEYSVDNLFGLCRSAIVLAKIDQVPYVVGIDLVHYANLLPTFFWINLVDAYRVDPQNTMGIRKSNSKERRFRASWYELLLSVKVDFSSDRRISPTIRYGLVLRFWGGIQESWLKLATKTFLALTSSEPK
jgi:hypothetical protein